MNEIKNQNAVDKAMDLWKFVDEALSEYTGTDNLQLPTLMEILMAKMGLDVKQFRKLDALVRFYISEDHPDWVSRRGAHGGVMRRADVQKKAQDILNKMLEKNKLKAVIEAKVSSGASSSLEKALVEEFNENMSHEDDGEDFNGTEG